MFYPLLELLMETVRDEPAGEIICLLDGVDECQPDAREQFLDEFGRLYCEPHGLRPAATCIKFLFKSQPIAVIDRILSRFEQAVNIIRFDGDEQTDAISEVINMVINKRVPGVVPALNASSQSIISEHLKATKHRTYLWLYLVLGEIQQNLPIYHEVGSIKDLIAELPNSVNAAYERSLNQSLDTSITWTILKIIVAAKRQLTALALTVAEAIIIIEEIDPVRTKIFASGMRIVLPTFAKYVVSISIHDSNVSLRHQTAREFLLRPTDD